MDKDDRYWAFIWSLVAIVVSTIVISIAVVNHNEDNLKAELISNDAAPAQLICAFNPTAENLSKDTICGTQFNSGE